MILTDYFRSQPDSTWDIARQCGVTHGVIRLSEDDVFDLTNKDHWQTVCRRFADFGKCGTGKGGSKQCLI